MKLFFAAFVAFGSGIHRANAKDRPGEHVRRGAVHHIITSDSEVPVNLVRDYKYASGSVDVPKKTAQKLLRLHETLAHTKINANMAIAIANDSNSIEGAVTSTCVHEFQDKTELSAAIDAYLANDCPSNTGCAIGQQYGHPMNNWCVSDVSDMSELFQFKDTFNEDISGWDLSSVTATVKMFKGAEQFNIDISGWNVASLTRLSGMFNNAHEFNQDLSSWNLPVSANVNRMFYKASKFNQDLCAWSDRIDYGSATDLFFGTGCAYVDTPSEDLRGPFCLSDCTDDSDTEGYCGCTNGCTQEVWDTEVSDQHLVAPTTCGDWIIDQVDFIENYPFHPIDFDYSTAEEDVCLMASNRFPECKACNPYLCDAKAPSEYCCSSCQDVWDLDGGAANYCGDYIANVHSWEGYAPGRDSCIMAAVMEPHCAPCNPETCAEEPDWVPPTCYHC